MIELATRIKDVEEYYFSKKLAEVRSLDTAEFPVINLGIGSPDLAPTEAAIDALTITAQKANSHGYQKLQRNSCLAGSDSEILSDNVSS
ncbi:MAG: hypothetical protein U5K54_20835 [Cytophagales bacterium]|nr:hypothetical protein [Cytophagales bacterium]